MNTDMNDDDGAERILRSASAEDAVTDQTREKGWAHVRSRISARGSVTGRRRRVWTGVAAAAVVVMATAVVLVARPRGATEPVAAPVVLSSTTTPATAPGSTADTTPETIDSGVPAGTEPSIPGTLEPSDPSPAQTPTSSEIGPIPTNAILSDYFPYRPCGMSSSELLLKSRYMDLSVEYPSKMEQQGGPDAKVTVVNKSGGELELGDWYIGLFKDEVLVSFVYPVAMYREGLLPAGVTRTLSAPMLYFGLCASGNPNIPLPAGRYQAYLVQTARAPQGIIAAGAGPTTVTVG
ncbi:hypothetical protein D1871_12780 [Nakamurella silvestris]|nr:hypothetical protein D1871_12780 [Nakamurella silvestris]